METPGASGRRRAGRRAPLDIRSIGNATCGSLSYHYGYVRGVRSIEMTDVYTPRSLKQQEASKLRHAERREYRDGKVLSDSGIQMSK